MSDLATPARRDIDLAGQRKRSRKSRPDPTRASAPKRNAAASPPLTSPNPVDEESRELSSPACSLHEFKDW